MVYKLLTEPTANPKVAKNLGFGVLTAPLHLAPFNLSGYQVCAKASKGCAAACLHTAGNPAYMKGKEAARIRKTKLMFENRTEFLRQLVTDIGKLEAAAKAMGLKAGVRLNATSDIQWENLQVNHDGNTYPNIMAIFPHVQFYDYTAIVKRARHALPVNYHLTFSRKEDNQAAVLEALQLGLNVAVVFSTKHFPATYLGSEVINGDEHDYRPADGKHKRGKIIGLKAKGKGRNDNSGFVVDVQQLTQLQEAA